MHLNQGGSFDRTQVADWTGLVSLGIGDIDADGDLDLLIGNLDGVPTLLRNEGRNGNSLRVRLIGGEGDRAAVGAKVTVRYGENTHTRWVTAGESFLSSNEDVLHFGVGDYLGPIRGTVALQTDVPGDSVQNLNIMGIVR